MFDDLKTQLTAVEGKLRAALAGFEGRVGALEGEIKSIDAPIATAFERFDHAVASVEGTIDRRIAGVRQQIAKLRP